MMPRFITPLEDQYDKKFPDSSATMFYPSSPEFVEYFRQKLSEAIERGSPLTRAEVEGMYAQASGFTDDLAYLAYAYRTTEEAILKGLR